MRIVACCHSRLVLTVICLRLKKFVSHQKQKMFGKLTNFYVTTKYLIIPEWRYLYNSRLYVDVINISVWWIQSFPCKNFRHKNASQSLKEKNLSEKSNQSSKVWREEHLETFSHSALQDIGFVFDFFIRSLSRNVSRTNYFKWSPY